ncbi:hypothetical protein [Roseateles sp.]|uniref:hypothetical protein n=1 Tax=Roseateles sp. TaxID=1971397 RepID=UPI0025FC52D1|nr:hypothetical protein [Roseateles sp.]MBV8033610.1 hypothetical protein [Roseateles sp.]
MSPQNDDELLKAERRRMAAAFGGMLDEPVPQRLQALVAEPAPAAQVVNLGAARAQRRGMPAWVTLGGMAATLLLGTLIGTRLAPPGGGNSGRLVATGAVAHALERQLASAPGSAPVAVQLSFRARDGRWCRTFTTGGSAGLACREADGAWALQQVAAADVAASGVMRQAASGLPASVLAAVDSAMAGEALNAEQERAARDAGWR